MEPRLADHRMPSSNQTVARSLLSIIWPFIAIVAAMLAIDHLNSSILLAARALSSAESDWSKAQKSAILNLERYAQTHDDAYYQAYLRYIEIVHGGSAARIELEQPALDTAQTRRGLERAKLDPDDVANVILLSRSYDWLPFMRGVFESWREADALVVAIEEQAEALHKEITTTPVDLQRVQTLSNNITVLDGTLTSIAEKFARRVGNGAREVHHVLAYARPAIGISLLLIAIAVSYRMVKRTYLTKNALRRSEERYQLATEGSNDGLWDWNLVKDELYFSPRAKALLGYADDELESRSDKLFSLIHAEDIGPLREALGLHLANGTIYSTEARYLTKSGIYRWFQIRGRATRDVHGKPIRMAGVITDIENEKQAEARLFAEKERAQVTLASIGEAVITTDQEGLIDYMNPVAERLTGWTLDEAQGLPPRRVCPMTNDGWPRRILDPVEQVLHDEAPESIPGNVLLIGRDGSDIAIKDSVAPIRNRGNEIIGSVLVLRDVRGERAFAAQLAYQASHDELTGLINRREFEARLLRTLTEKSTIGSSSMMYLDLDQFKIVNDTSGHRAGDELMRQIGMLLQSRLHPDDILARIGGDEFGVLLENSSPEDAVRIAESLCRGVGDFRYTWGERQFSVGVSIGLVHLDRSMRNIADVFSAGDSACYLAKEKGRNRVQIFRVTDQEMSLMRGQIEWVGRINEALESNRFCLYEQKFQSLQDDCSSSTHSELLLRMLDVDGSIIPPMAFIPAAQRYNLISAIDRWVTQSAFTTIASRQASADQPRNVYGINLSGPSISDQQFYDFVCRTADDSGVDPHSICFEITETEAIANLRSATRFMQELRARGFLFALDDFGAGMSSFGYLKHLPVDYIKIDGSFVKNLTSDAIGEAMVMAINDIGHLMDKRTIAECVEDDACLQRLRDIGVDFAQGFCVARPAPFTQCAAPPDPVLGIAANAAGFR